MRAALKVLAPTAVALGLALQGCAPPATVTNGMPDPSVWTAHPSSTANYADYAAVANAVSTDTGARIRIITSGTSIGRIAPIRAGIADMGRLADEHFFAFEGIDEFAKEEWGPQNVRVVWAPLSPAGLVARGDADVDEPSDLAGKKVPHIAAASAINLKIDAVLAYGGLTEEDVDLVPMTLEEQFDAFAQGEIDVVYANAQTPALYEVESKTDINWVHLDDEDDEAMARMAEVDPTLTEIGVIENAAGQEPGETDGGIIVSVAVVAYTDLDDEAVYRTVKSIGETYPAYRETSSTTPTWGPEVVRHEPTVVPYHDGAVRYLKEEGLWSEEADARNEELKARGERLQAEWPRFLESAGSDDDMLSAWTKWTARTIDPEHAP